MGKGKGKRGKWKARAGDARRFIYENASTKVGSVKSGR